MVNVILAIVIPMAVLTPVAIVCEMYERATLSEYERNCDDIYAEDLED